VFRLCTLAFGAALLLAAPAFADTQTLFESGPWVLYGGTSNSGHALCGMRVSDTAGNRTIHIKYFAGDDHLTFQMFKTTWQVPSGTRLAVTMQMGANPLWSAHAYGEADHVEFTIPYSGLDNFAREFRYSQMMRITFPQGSEAPWITSLAGTNVMLDRFIACMRDIRNAQPPGGGQPYSGPPGPPPQPSQPFGGGGPAAPGPVPPGGGPGGGSPGPGDVHKNFGESGGPPGGGGPPAGGAPGGGGLPYRGDGAPSPQPAPPQPPTPPAPSGGGTDSGRI